MAENDTTTDPLATLTSQVQALQAVIDSNTSTIANWAAQKAVDLANAIANATTAQQQADSAAIAKANQLAADAQARYQQTVDDLATANQNLTEANAIINGPQGLEWWKQQAQQFQAEVGTLQAQLNDATADAAQAGAGLDQLIQFAQKIGGPTIKAAFGKIASNAGKQAAIAAIQGA